MFEKLKKRWIQNYDKALDKIFLDKLKNILGEFRMDNLQSENGEDFFGLFQESFNPLKVHVDTGFDENNIAPCEFFRESNKHQSN